MVLDTSVRCAKVVSFTPDSLLLLSVVVLRELPFEFLLEDSFDVEVTHHVVT